MKIWVKVKRLLGFKIKPNLKEHWWYNKLYNNIDTNCTKAERKRLHRSLNGLHLVLTGKAGDERILQYVNPHTKCLKLY